MFWVLIPYMVPTYKDRDLRKAVALEKAKAPTEAAAMSDPKKKKAYLHYMDHTSVPMGWCRSSRRNLPEGH